jgi:hypothetical protein
MGRLAGCQWAYFNGAYRYRVERVVAVDLADAVQRPKLASFSRQSTVRRKMSSRRGAMSLFGNDCSDAADLEEKFG